MSKTMIEYELSLGQERRLDLVAQGLVTPMGETPLDTDDALRRRLAYLRGL